MSTTPPKRRPLVPILGGCALLAACVCLAAAAAGAYFYFNGRQASAEPTVEYVLDSSPRMDNPSRGGEPRYVVARGVLAEIVRTADPRLTAGLRVFGTGAVAQGCQDTDLVVPLTASGQGMIEGELGGIAPAPASDSAMAEAMIAAIRDMASTDGPHSIIVVTGGVDSCNPEAGELVRREAERAGIELRMFVVGFEVPEEEVAAVKAFVDLVPGASYTDAPDATALRTVLTGVQTEVDRMADEAFETEPEESASGGGCDHPYLPLRSGATWAYATTEGPVTWTVTAASGSSATVDIGSSVGVFTFHWTCGAEGIVSYDFGRIDLFDFGEVGNLEVTDTSGTWLPSAGSMTPGASWSNNFTTRFAMTVEGTSVEVASSTSESWTLAGLETVTVPAGTFDAIRIDGTAITSVEAFMGFSVPASTYSQTYWLAEGVGIIRYVSNSEGYSGSGDLTSYSVP